MQVNFLIIILFLVGAGINFWDTYFYPNYFFSHFGLDPDKITFLVAIMFVVVLTIKLNTKKIFNILITLSALILFVRLSQVSGKAAGILVKTLFSGPGYSRSIILNTYGRKYEFIEWLRTIVPENSSILLPPDQLPWRHTGSLGLMQAWLYPRNVYSATQKYNLDNLKKFNYVLISSESDGSLVHTWPDFSIPSTKIIIYDWDNQSGKIYKLLNYYSQDWQKKQPWGLIIPKH